MKLKIVFTVCAAMFAASLGIAPAADLKFSLSRKTLSQKSTQDTGGIVKSRVEARDIVYSIVVESTSLRDIENITIEYNIYYEVPENPIDKAPVKTLAGKHTINKLPSYKKVEFDTDSIAMKETRTVESRTSLGVTRTASAQIKDKIVGNVIRAYNAEGKLLGEYINPSGTDTKFDWKKP